MFVRSCVQAIVLAVVLSAVVTPALAQSAEFAGIVRDSSGAVIAGSTVMVRQSGSSFERMVESGRDGRFVIRPLAAGEYQLEVIAQGFALLSAPVTMPSATELVVTLHPAPVIEAVQVVSASRQEELREALNTNVSVIASRPWCGPNTTRTMALT